MLSTRATRPSFVERFSSFAGFGRKHAGWRAKGQQTIYHR